MMTRQDAELHPAYVWDCDECGAENFTRAVVHEFSPEEAGELTDAGLSPTTGNWMTYPDVVRCRSCQHEFDARHFRQGDDAVPRSDD
jgi:hypothetical protein